MDFKKSRKEAVVAYAKSLEVKNNSLEKMSVRVKELETQISKLNSKQMTLQNEVNNKTLLHSDKVKLLKKEKAKVVTLVREKASLKSDLAKADGKVDALTLDLKTKNKDISKLEEQLKATEELYAKEQALSKSRKEDISDLKSSINIKNDTLGALREKNKKGLADARMIQELNNSWMLRVYHLFVSIPS